MRRLGSSALAVVLAALSGCALGDREAADAGTVDEFAPWTQPLRPLGSDWNGFLHSDGRCDEIERNLGVRAVE